jgi:hypothetical protein
LSDEGERSACTHGAYPLRNRAPTKFACSHDAAPHGDGFRIEFSPQGESYSINTVAPVALRLHY